MDAEFVFGTQKFIHNHMPIFEKLSEIEDQYVDFRKKRNWKYLHFQSYEPSLAKIVQVVLSIHRGPVLLRTNKRTKQLFEF